MTRLIHFTLYYRDIITLDFVNELFSRFLDICDAIEDGSTEMLDHSDFSDTDIPYDIVLPEDHSIPVRIRPLLICLTFNL